MYKSRQYDVIKHSDTLVYGKSTLQSVDSKRTNLVFGGELVAQSIMAAWETVEEGWVPNSFHSYFMRPASCETTIRYEIVHNSDGQNYRNRLVNCFQGTTDKLCFVALISFGRGNNMHERRLKFSENPSPNLRNVPYGFQCPPNDFFYKYKDNMDKLISIVHTNGHIDMLLPPELFSKPKAEENALEVGERRLGFFTRVNVDGIQEVNKKWNYIDFSFVSDANTLVLLFRSMGIPWTPEKVWFVYATMDHNVYFHDDDFNITEWLFVDYRFITLNNGRVFFISHYYSKEAKLVGSVAQEAQVQIPKKVADAATGGTYHL